ncbi:pulmonary surfactant-associated protein A-like [Dendropsophus ebraccatus]|uniref:pulmonary surfactant-associated protein A-like n=1 Tax=Dendropsophus ebraccatus TaxID=150705 RepID=UPI003832231C
MFFPTQTISFLAVIFIMLFTLTLSDTSPACCAIQGLPGLNGRDGRDGVNGLKGDPGPPGEVGKPGVKGSNGSPGKQGPIGKPGSSGLPGQKGEKGNIGLQGLPGVKGEKSDNSGQLAMLSTIQSRLSSLEARLDKLQRSILTRTKALLFARGASSGEKTFVTNGEVLPYDQLKALCQKAGGHLASPRNMEENQAVLHITQFYKVPPFLGITDIQTEGTFRYPDGKPITYLNWNRGEPNQTGEEDCVEMFSDGKWNDKSCQENRLVICEF